MTTLSAADRERYARQLVIPEISEIGQLRLRQAAVLIVGLGGLGSPAALYLAAAGVGRLGLVDADAVEVSNLQRQVLHGTMAIGQPKTDSAASRLSDLNPGVTLEVHHLRLAATNALALVRRYDVVIDAVDNFGTRYLLNDACHLASVPLVEAGVSRFDGLGQVIRPGDGPCYRCAFPHRPAPGSRPSPREAGVIGPLPGIMGAWQALEALKLILGIGDAATGRLLAYNALTGRFEEIALSRDPQCPLCGETPAIRALEPDCPDYR